MSRFYSRRDCLSLACLAAIAAVCMDLKNSVLAQGGCTGGCHMVRAIAYQDTTPGVVLGVHWFPQFMQGFPRLANGPSQGDYKNGVGDIPYVECPGGAALRPFYSTVFRAGTEGQVPQAGNCITGDVQSRICDPNI